MAKDSILPDFQAFLRSRKLAAEKHIPYYAHWAGHQNLQTTMIYTHVATKNILGVRSPLDR